MFFVEIGSLAALTTHTRFFVTLRSQEDAYHSLILFRLSQTLPADTQEGNLSSTPGRKDDTETLTTCFAAANKHQIYAMEAACPHLGADMSHADIEEYETSVVAVCPWHRYDFDLRTGRSETGLQACTYDVEVRDNGMVWLQCPEGGTGWRLVELRPVSEAFADPPPEQDTPQHNNPTVTIPLHEEGDVSVVPENDPPRTLVQWAVLILNTPDPQLKVARTRHAVQLFRTGKLASFRHRTVKVVDGTNPHHDERNTPPEVPPRHAAYNANTVTPALANKRRGRAAMLHALANIEQWAVDLAWDIIARFGPAYPHILPPAFYADWTKVALDEAKHFTLLTARLRSMGVEYGSLPVHAGLWESAQVTSDSLRARLAIIHLVHEARGLDVNPQTIDRFRKQGDVESVKSLEIIHADEVTHVTAGHRWFTWCCAHEGVDPVPTFRAEVRKNWRGEIKGPFNVEDRERAGMAPEFYTDLRGEMDNWTDL